MHKLFLSTVLTLALSAVGFSQTVTSYDITEAKVKEAQKGWCSALVKINETKESGGNYSQVASDIIDAAYGYQSGIVLFKPTLASGEQTFRMSKEGALAYFVGGSSKYKGDDGFALKGWKRCESKPSGIILSGDTALSMGNVHMWNAKGEETVVDKTWGYKMDDEGNLRIVLHHSSLPYKPAK